MSSRRSTWPSLAVGAAVLLLGLVVVRMWGDTSAADPTVGADGPATSARGTSGSASGQSGARTPAFAAYQPGSPERIDSRAGTETSGIVVSRSDRDVMFTVDDTTAEDHLGVVRTDGSWVGRIEVKGMGAANAEALTAGPCAKGSSRSCLYIGDIGDHIGRDHVTIYRLAEPNPGDLPSKPVPAAIWRYTYPDGPYDAEALLVDASGNLVVVTKRKLGTEADGTSRIYRGRPGGGRLRYVSTVRLPRAPLAVQSLFVGNVVTDATWQPGRVLLLTYDQVVEYVAPSRSADPAGFASWPHRSTSLTSLEQAEGVSLRSRDSGVPCGFVAAGEGRGDGQAQVLAAGCEE